MDAYFASSVGPSFTTSCGCTEAVEDAHIRAYFPLPDWEQKTSYYGPARFRYDAIHDLYHCPQGQPLYPFSRQETRECVLYRADPATCNACPVKAQCTECDHGRQLRRSFHADYLERVKGYHQTFAYQKAMNKRKVWIEPLFGEAKQWHGMQRFRLRRLWRVNCEALLTATGQNLKRLLRKRGWGRRPFPIEAVVAMSPPDQETEQIPMKDRSRPRVAVASFDLSRALNPFFATQISSFYWFINVLQFSLYSV